MMAGVLHAAWMLLCRREAARFRRALGDVEASQSQRLQEILAANARSAFGRGHDFTTIRSVKEFRRRVPLSTYADYHEAIQRMGCGESNILTSGPVRLFEPTSGTSGGEKLIPYTPDLGREFQRAIATWLYDLFSSRPALRRGRAYWSVSPNFGAARRSPAGIPIGFDDDAAYLGGIGRCAVERLMIRPPGIANVHDLDSFRYCTLLWLLRAADLTLVSIWSPTFLTTLVASLDTWQDRLCGDIRRGSVTPPSDLPPSVAALMRLALTPDPFRARQLESIFSSSVTSAEKLSEIWPRLALISCWSDASASGSAAHLHDLFPNVEIQPKGLLATEACVSIPLVGRAGSVLALRSHYFEFESMDGSIRGAHELKAGERYLVVVTTGGGLYRYRLCDEIEVIGFEAQCPLIRFVGKADQVSDLAGEKLDEVHVAASLQKLFLQAGLLPHFAVVAPVASIASAPPHYCLYLQLNDPGSVDEEFLAAMLESELAANPHYRYAVGLGQLSPVRVRIFNNGCGGPRDRHEQARIATGQKLGAIKPLALEKNPDVARQLAALPRRRALAAR